MEQNVSVATDRAVQEAEVNVKDVQLSEAHHHFGDLLIDVRFGTVIRLWNGTRKKVVAVLMPPALAERLLPVEDEQT